MKTNKELMIEGSLYHDDEELREDMAKCRKIIREINSSDNEENRQLLFHKLFGKTGENCNIQSPFHCDYGKNIYIGNNFYANYDNIMLDVCPIHIGDNVFLGPRVCIYTALHPLDATIRNEGYEYGKSVTIGNNVWIGGNCTILPGVKIGNNVVIGAGSLVTKDIDNNVLALGNPCVKIREINDIDKAYWSVKKDEYEEMRNK